MQELKLEKFHDFLDRITKDNNKNIVQTCRDGFDLIYKGDTSTNPYAQDDTIEPPDSTVKVASDNKRQISNLDVDTQKMVNAIIDKFGVTVHEIHDNYLIFHTKLTIPQYFKYVMEQDTWESKAYYSNDEGEYYAKIPEKYATIIKNKYRDHGHNSGL